MLDRLGLRLAPWRWLADWIAAGRQRLWDAYVEIVEEETRHAKALRTDPSEPLPRRRLAVKTRVTLPLGLRLRPLGFMPDQTPRRG